MIEKIQLELTTSCNLSCEYCLRPNMISELDQEIVEKVNGMAKKFVLYGYGEPLLHDKLLDLVKLLDGELVLSTNGMVDEKFYEVADLVDLIGISLDLNDSLRRGMELNKILRKLDNLKGKAVAEIVLTKENFPKLSELAEKLAERSVDIMATNLIAPNSEIYAKALYFEGSRDNADFLHVDEDFVLKMLKTRKPEQENLDIIHRNINLCALIEAKDRIRLAKKSESEIERIEEIAKSYGVNFTKPKFFGEVKQRECPYRDSIFVRADSLVSPCMPFAYTHIEFVNRRKNIVQEFVFGSLKDEIDEIIEIKHHFETLRTRMDFPYCGDCGHTAGCWFLENGMDCYVNKPSCAQCLYSVGIAKCLI
ncbi:MAG: radical SAM protein [Archaeoglobaceae archaeon]|nr:radical SAM protein [Archaeoglobaceae archaeon]MDW8117903.1 radical SAM protein [Archaeoglobaceae archaeon]